MTIKLSIISGHDLPIADRGGTSDPYVKVYSIGALKSYVARTKVIDANLNPVWNESFIFPGLRGCKLIFEVYDHDSISKNTKIAHAIYDMTYFEMNTQVDLSLTKDIPKGGNNPRLRIAVSVQPDSPKALPSRGVAPIKAPMYLSFDPDNSIDINPPFSKVRGVPYLIPYNLSIIAFIPSTGAYHVLNNDNRLINGAVHSGVHPCFSIMSFSEVIRLEASELTAAKYGNLFVVLSTPNFEPISKYFSTGNITIWVSQEKAKQNVKGDVIQLEGKEFKFLSLTPVMRIPIKVTKEATMVVAATATFPDSNSISFSVTDFQFPNESHLDYTITPQTAHFAAPFILQLFGHMGALQAKKYPSFPLCVPISLDKVFSFIGSPRTSIISGQLVNIKEHKFAVCALDYAFAPKETSLGNTKRLLEGAIELSPTSFNINLSSIPDDIMYIVFSIAGTQPMIEEGVKSKNIILGSLTNLINLNDPASTPLVILTSNGTQELMNFAFPRSKLNNSLVWFTLFRDPFGSWAVLNMKRPFDAKEENAIFMQSISLTQNMFKAFQFK